MSNVQGDRHQYIKHLLCFHIIHTWSCANEKLRHRNAELLKSKFHEMPYAMPTFSTNPIILPAWSAADIDLRSQVAGVDWHGPSLTAQWTSNFLPTAIVFPRPPFRVYGSCFFPFKNALFRAPLSHYRSDLPDFL